MLTTRRWGLVPWRDRVFGCGLVLPVHIACVLVNRPDFDWLHLPSALLLYFKILISFFACFVYRGRMLGSHFFVLPWRDRVLGCGLVLPVYIACVLVNRPDFDWLHLPSALLLYF